MKQPIQARIWLRAIPDNYTDKDMYCKRFETTLDTEISEPDMELFEEIYGEITECAKKNNIADAIGFVRMRVEPQKDLDGHQYVCSFKFNHKQEAINAYRQAHYMLIHYYKNVKKRYQDT